MTAIGHVAVVGSGVAAAVAAAALAHRLPHLRVTIVEVPTASGARRPDRDHHARGGGVHDAMGIADADLVRRTRGDGGWGRG
ncbi:NAD(P)-binding protein [Sphingomonas sp. MMS24-JH45]